MFTPIFNLLSGFQNVDSLPGLIEYGSRQVRSWEIGVLLFPGKAL